MNEELFEKLLLVRAPRVGPVKYAQMLARFGTAGAALQYLGLGNAHRDTVSCEVERARQLNIHYIFDDDVRYPARLRAVKNHPPVISARGNLETLGRPAVAIVGTRHATGAGMNFVHEMASAFAARGVTVVSGMAMGTDTAAHLGALSAAGDAQTIAVLAGGVDYIWPLENESLYYRIMERGAVISEMPVGFMPNATNFVQRNRWVAATADKLILGEADLKSGSMTTARFAMEYARQIWAIPSHPADPRAAGPNSLIASGVAQLCQGISDFFPTDAKMDNKQKKEQSENILLDAIGTIAISESVLADIVKKSISEIKRDLVILELQGMVRKTDGGYVRT